MRLTGESHCVVSFVQSPSLTPAGEKGTIGVTETSPSSSWWNRISSSCYQTHQTLQLQRKKRQRYKARSREGRGKEGMLLRFLVDVLRTFYFLVKQILTLSKRKVFEYQAIRYPNCPLSPALEIRLFSVRRKIMVLDLDETLIHSHHDNSTVLPVTDSLPDFYVRVFIENHPVKFYVYKRPHVDFFLSVVSQWYDLVIFTASMQKYGMEVANHLDRNKGILPRRYFRQDCTMDMNGYTKNLSMICEDLSNIFILDNSPSAYRGNPNNAIPITSWFSDPLDTELLDLLPFLDSLRFTHDVRSVLSRNLHQHSLW